MRRQGEASGKLAWLLVTLAVTACAKTAADGRAEASGGTKDEAMADDAAVTGSSGFTGGGAGALGTGLGGAASGETPGGAGGKGGEPSVLAPLDTDDATLDQARGAELIELALRIGYAHGYALCSCASPFPIAEEQLPACAEAESRFPRLFDSAVRQCVIERASEVPGFVDALRCPLRNLRSFGRNFAACPQGQDTRGAGSEPISTCATDEATQRLINAEGCESAFWCDDGTLIHEGRCDQTRDCDDSSDERGCGDVQCGDELVDRYEACVPELCGAFEPPLCTSSDGRFSVLCGDGTTLGVDKLCDGRQDCATGRDEQYCL